MTSIVKAVKKGLLEGIIAELNESNLNLNNILDLSAGYQNIASVHNCADEEENLLLNKVGLSLLTTIKTQPPEQVGYLSKAYQRIATTHQNNHYLGEKA